MTGFEPVTCCLRNSCSAAELHRPPTGQQIYHLRAQKRNFYRLKLTSLKEKVLGREMHVNATR